MDWPASYKPASEHTPTDQDDGLIVIQDESDPDPLLLASFSTIPMGIYSPRPTECQGGLSPCSMPPLSSCSTPAMPSSRRPSVEDCLSFSSDSRVGAQLDPNDWFSFSSMSDPLQERVALGLTPSTSRRPSIQEDLSFLSDRRGSAQLEQPDSQGFSLSTSAPLQERAGSGAVLMNGRITCQRSNSATVRSLNSNTPLFRCRWEGCQSSTLFRREADLLRHLRTIHIAPEAYNCPEKNCDRVFGRKDHVAQHVKRRHPR